MSTPATILAQLKAQLIADATLADYVKQIMIGVREEISEFPCLVLEPVSLMEGDDVYKSQELNFSVAVMGYIKVANPDKQIVGDTEIKGILDFENDVKKAISSDLTIGANVLHTRITESKYDFVDYPIRSFVLNVDLYFRQALSTRT